MKKTTPSLILLCLIACFAMRAQNSTAKWYFGSGAAIDFMTSPPANISSTTWSNNPSLTSIADVAGNLLFYTSGSKIWNSTHALIGNGSGLLSDNRSAMIVQRPGSSNLYYLFTIYNGSFGSPNPPGLYYSVVDMSLAAGQGSVTVKNALLCSDTLCQKLTGTRHSNGSDYWIVVKECSGGNNNVWSGIYSFSAYQLSAGGINTSASVSTFTYNSGSVYANSVKIGQMKISPSGKKLACSNYGFTSNYDNHAGSFELFDFDNSTGKVSNFTPLYNAMAPSAPQATSTRNTPGFGVEFSPDASKLYGTLSDNYYYSNGAIIEWDLCSGNNALVAATQTSITPPVNNNINGYSQLQLGRDGKIYVSNYGLYNNSISVINNPNAYGAASGFSLSSLSLSPALPLGFYLPNFMGSDLFLAGSISGPNMSIVSSPVGCQALQFQSPMTAGTAVGNCPANSYTLQNLQWNFGDPASANSNTSSTASPTHTYSSPGVYTVNLVLNFGNGNSQMLTQLVNVVYPAFGSLSYMSSVGCFGATTATAGYVNSQSANQSYAWTNGISTYTQASPMNLGAGTWTSVVTNTITGCQASSVFTIQQPQALVAIASSSAVCQQGTVHINTYGGTAPFNYTWPNNSSNLPIGSGLVGPNTVTVTDANGCSTTGSFVVTPPPALSVSGLTVCAGVTATLHATGALTYTWSNYSVSDFFYYNIPQPGFYPVTVIGTDVNGCISNLTTVMMDMMDCYTSIETHGDIENANVFPNPSSGEINVAISGKATATLFNAVGELILSTELSDKQQLQIEHSGIYFLRLQSGNRLANYKLVVVK